MEKFETAYAQLNAAQKRAVNTIEGPVLVIAGPGTGKTQLLSIRAGKILQKTDVSPENILCITFTEAAAQEMHNRLYRLIGPAGSRVNVYTFHGFGADIINRYPEYFDYRRRGLVQLDDIGRYSILEELLASLPYRHPFAGQDEYGQFTALKAVEKGLSAIKQSALSSKDLRKLLAANSKAIDVIEPMLQDCFNVPRLGMKHIDAIEQVATQLHNKQAAAPLPGYLSLERTVSLSLLQAIAICREEGRTGAIGKWRNQTLRRKNGKYALYARTKTKEFESLINLYEKYQALLDERGLFDYADMILWVLRALQTSADLRLMLAEQYLYIMVDEFQDTNGAQNQLINELSGIAYGNEQPNVLAVGDDDQAIMRFQGAEVSNMLDFARLYQLDAASIITLTDNYRSHQAIITASREIITQTNDRLEVSLQEHKITKMLHSKTSIAQPLIKHMEFGSRPEEFHWVAERIHALIAKGHKAEDIAVIAPKHAILTNLVPYLQYFDIPVSYERRENVLNHTLIRQIITIAKLVVAVADSKLDLADSLLAEVITYPFWQLSVHDRANLAFSTDVKKKRWLQAMLKGNNKLSTIAETLLAIKDQIGVMPLEAVFDMIIGTRVIPGTSFVSPLRAYYFSDEAAKEQGSDFVRTLSSLSTLREAARSHYRRETFSLRDFLAVIELYGRSGIMLVDTNPLTERTKAVQLTTAHGAKGREFTSVFIISARDDDWGAINSSFAQQAYLPENLPIYPAGNIVTDKLRLFYVAMTRARQTLYITAHRVKPNGQPAKPLLWLDLPGEGWWTAQQAEQPKAADIATIIATDWRQAYELPRTSLGAALQSKLANYRLNATHLKDFLDLRYGGPEHFKMIDLYKFPEAKSFSACLGSAVHNALEKAQLHLQTTGKLCTPKELLRHYYEALEREQMLPTDKVKAGAHGAQILPAFYKAESKRMRADDLTERFVSAELNGMRLNGKLDRIIPLKGTHVRIVDYKTGRAPEPDWETAQLSPNKQASVHFNKQQLLFYKLLVEHSVIDEVRRTVDSAELRFVEPHIDTGQLITLSIAKFDPEELKRLQDLMKAVWQHIMKLEFPDVGKYPKSLKGIKTFEDDLLRGTI